MQVALEAETEAQIAKEKVRKSETTTRSKVEVIVIDGDDDDDEASDDFNEMIIVNDTSEEDMTWAILKVPKEA